MREAPLCRILAIGDELILGRTVDTNSAWLAAWAGGYGLRVDRVSVIGDRQDEGEAALRAAIDGASCVLITGGLGPTDDDRTRHVLAAVLGEPLADDPHAWRAISECYRRLGRLNPPASNRRQALRPSSAELLANDRGTAPGLLAKHRRCLIASFPGVPHEMHAMAERLGARLPRLIPGLRVPVIGELYLAGIGESAVQELIPGLLSERDPQVGITASELGHLTLRVVGTKAAVARRIEALRRPVQRWRIPQQGIAPSLVAWLSRHRASVATAESCTVGHVAALLGSVAGASRVLREGVITYASDSKCRRLAVPAALIAREGVVSARVAEAMVRGVQAVTGCDLAIATTGIAGPSGGTRDIPVGTVYVGLAWQGRTTTKVLHLQGSRERIQRRAAAQALVAAWEMVTGRI